MFDVGLYHFLVLAIIMFIIGLMGLVLNRRNVIVILISVELMLLAVNINFVAFSSYLGNVIGNIFALFVLTVAAAEAAIGLAIIIVFFRTHSSIDIEDATMLEHSSNQ